MSGSRTTLAELSAKAALDREDLAAAISDLRERVDEKKARWSSRGFWAGMLAAGAVSAYRMLHRDSLSSKVARWGSAASTTVTIARLLGRLFRVF